MKFLFLILIYLTNAFSSVDDSNTTKVKYISIKAKKDRFYKLIIPAVNQVHSELLTQYNLILKDINSTKTQELKKIYKVETTQELLEALKPHPKSITLAQAAMESGWATSRFFLEANNIFGMWSSNKNEPRIPAKEKRAGKKTIWLKKFKTIEDSVRAYYKLLATARAYKTFRQTRFKTNDPYVIVKKLDKYSELGDEYTKKLIQVIKYNKLTNYDNK